MVPPAQAPPDAPPRPPIDPRLRARRIAVRRDEGRRRLRRLLLVAGAVVVAAAGWGATRSPLLDVDRVVVAGTERTTPAEVVAASGIEPGQAMVDVDGGVAGRAVEDLPWVAGAGVAREWPGTIRITVTERRAAAAAPARGGGWAVLDGTGHVLEHREEAPARLPAVRGLPAAGAPGAVVGGEATGGALELASLLGAVLAPVLPAILPEDREVTLGAVVVTAHEATLEATVPGPGPGQGIVVAVGPPDELAAKVRALVTVLEQADLVAVERIDVRVPGAPVLTRAGGEG